MNVMQAIIEALISLTANKLRSSLTILGIVIGVAAVIAMIAIGQGAQTSITSSINGIGTNLIFISQGGQSRDVRNAKPLTLQDAQALMDKTAAPAVVAVAPIIQGRFDIAVGSNTTSTQVSGVTAGYASLSNELLIEGEFINSTNISGRSMVAVLGPTTAQNLFGRTSGLVGLSIRIQGKPFRVIGLLKAKGGSGFGNQDDRVLIPITTAQTRLTRRSGGTSGIDQIQVQASSAETVKTASTQVSAILRARHRTKPGLDDFTIFTQQQIVDTATSITGVLTLFLGGIAGISLLVGGIGIMNIMLVSVSERTREIGLRKALGARKRDILAQFLVESVLLSLIGGALGVGLAWVLTSIVKSLAASSSTAINPVIGLNSVLLATLFSMSIGLLFGIYPANRASNLTPVEALRYE